MEMETKELLDKYSREIEVLDISNNNIKGILRLNKFYRLKELNCSNNQITRIKSFPSSLQYLNCYNNQITKIKNLPRWMKSFNCSKNPITYLEYPFEIPPTKYPKNLTHLILSNYNEPLDNLPNTITYLNIGYLYRQSLDNLPNSIMHLKIGNSFDKPLDNLPNTITCLEFDEFAAFNQLVDNLPNSITHIVFGSDFNQPIDNLPKSVVNLTLGERFSYPINVIAKQLKRINMRFANYVKFNENYLNVEFNDDCEVIFTVVYMINEYQYEYDDVFTNNFDIYIKKMQNKHKNCEIHYRMLS
jgi:hypothetical protein